MDDDRVVKIREKHPRWIRWSHWINFPVITLMIWSGLMIYWANPQYYPPFFPGHFFEIFNLDRRLADAMSIHFALMWIFILNGVLYVGYVVVSGEWRDLLPQRRSVREAIEVVLHDLGLRRDLPPQGKLNAAQRFAYTGVLLMGMGSVLTGLAMYKPTQLHWLTSCFGGYECARAVHFALTLVFVLFFVVHIAQVIRAGWNNFRAMVAGFEVEGK